MSSRSASARTTKKLRAATIATFILTSSGMSSAIAQSVTSGVDQTIRPVCIEQCGQEEEKLTVDYTGNATLFWREWAPTFAKFDLSTGKWGISKILPLQGDVIGFDRYGNALSVGLVGEIFFEDKEYYFSRYIGAQRTSTAPAVIPLELDYRTSLSDVQLTENGDAFVSIIDNFYDGSSGGLRYDVATNMWLNAPELPGRVTADKAGNALFVSLEPRNMGEDAVVQSINVVRFDRATSTYSGLLKLDPDQDEGPDVNGPPPTTTKNLLAVSKDTIGNDMILYEDRRTVTDDFCSINDCSKLQPVGIKSLRYLARTKQWILKTVPKLNNNPLLAANMAADRFGNVNAVWTQYSGGYVKVVTSRYSSTTGKWSQARLLSSGSYHTRDASLATDYNGNVFATFSQRTDTGTGSSLGKIFRTKVVRYSKSANTWGVPVTIQDANRNAYKPQIVVDKYQRAIVIWNQDATTAGLKELKSDVVVAR